MDYLGGRLGRVLEIGAGCGYQSAVLAQLAGRVFSVERIEAMAYKLRTRLHELRITNVRVRHGDGFQGWSEHAPFDAILVAAAPVGVPVTIISPGCNVMNVEMYSISRRIGNIIRDKTSS